MGGSCLLPDGNVPLAARKCLVSSDCATLRLNTCCGEDRVVGVTKYPNCTVFPTRCGGDDCEKPPGFVTDDGAKTLDRGELRVTCQLTEPGGGLCRSLVVNVSAVVCGKVRCKVGEVCVHLSPRGGPAPRCFPVPHDGVCPPDSAYADCDGGPGSGPDLYCRDLSP